MPPTRKSIWQKGVVKPFGPHQRIIRSGSVHALNTSSRGASKMRSMTSSCSAGSTPGLFPGVMLLLLCFLVVILLLLCLNLAQVIVQTVEALVPETPIVLQPVGDVLEGTRLEPAGTPLRLAAAR